MLASVGNGLGVVSAEDEMPIFLLIILAKFMCVLNGITHEILRFCIVVESEKTRPGQHSLGSSSCIGSIPVKPILMHS